MEFTIRNPYGAPLTVDIARALGIEVVPDSSGQLAAVYDLDDEAEAEENRAKGFVVERVRR